LETIEVGTIFMKVQLVVVRGKPEGKVIPLVGPCFKIGRGETCHLRPNSEQVSREHAEFAIVGEVLSVKDLGSRNGTLVNGKALTTEACQLKDRDLVQVGPLTFAVSILEVRNAVTKTPSPSAGVSKPSLDDVSTEDIDSWLVGPNSPSSPDIPTAVYGGDTLTISAFKDGGASAAKPAPAPAPATPPSASDDEYERQPDDLEEVDEPYDDGNDDDEDATIGEGGETVAEVPEEFIDESNPFFAAKKAQQLQAKQGSAGPSKAAFKDTSDAAGDILRRLMERRRAEKS
jgi:pSer/pThr/pTyr-binding forkhead associated (FHA) protein